MVDQIMIRPIPIVELFRDPMFVSITGEQSGIRVKRVRYAHLETKFLVSNLLSMTGGILDYVFRPSHRRVSKIMKRLLRNDLFTASGMGQNGRSITIRNGGSKAWKDLKKLYMDIDVLVFIDTYEVAIPWFYEKDDIPKCPICTIHFTHLASKLETRDFKDGQQLRKIINWCGDHKDVSQLSSNMEYVHYWQKFGCNHKHVYFDRRYMMDRILEDFMRVIRRLVDGINRPLIGVDWCEITDIPGPFDHILITEKIYVAACCWATMLLDLSGPAISTTKLCRMADSDLLEKINRWRLRHINRRFICKNLRKGVVAINQRVLDLIIKHRVKVKRHLCSYNDEQFDRRINKLPGFLVIAKYDT